jgi:uncharacterized protein (TIGR03084 family)
MSVPPVDPGAVTAGLSAERARLVELLADLPEPLWRTPTGVEGWVVADHVAHLALLDEAVTLARTAPRRFATHARARRGRRGAADLDVRVRTGPELLARLAGTQDALARAFRDTDPGRRLPWYGADRDVADRDVATALTALLTETWAHGGDVAEALGAPWPATDRLWPVADLGIRGLGGCFEALGRPVPTVPARVELIAPDGTTWAWGREQARERVSGTAEELCLVLTGRREPAATGLRVSGVVAAEWLAIARPYPGAGPPPTRRRLDARAR